METIKPDSRGRIPLSRFTKVCDHYLISVNDNGVITLIPATVRPAIMDELEQITPNFAEALEKAVEGGRSTRDVWRETLAKARSEPESDVSS